MLKQFFSFTLPHFLILTLSMAGERSVVSLRDFRSKELKVEGIELGKSTAIHIQALGAGGASGATWSGEDLFARGWIINARTRAIVWEMTKENTSEEDDDLSCEENIKLEPGSYEVYFAAPTFSYHTWRSHFTINIDHRKKPLFGGDEGGDGEWFKGWWTEDLPGVWEKRSKEWGIDLLVKDSDASSVQKFSAPRDLPNVVFKATGLGEHEVIRQGITLNEPLAMSIYALGEKPDDADLADFGWMVNAATRERVWEMTPRNTHHAGGADKNVMFSRRVTLDKGEYVLYYITDDSHSSVDWNAPPPFDPLNWGVTLSTETEAEMNKVKPFDYREDENVIAKITKVGNDEYRQEEFSLKDKARLRVYAFGEQSNSRRTLADYGYIMDARTREKAWEMDVDRCSHAGGASKNLFVDELINLPKGSYVLTYKTDDSHSYDDWNDSPPFDEEHYGITLMGAGKNFKMDVVSKGGSGRDNSAIAQIGRVGNNADKSQRFHLDRPTKVRIYAIGEGQKRTMYDYGWIENAKTGDVVWEMTYAMGFHAGGARKNRMVNTTILLEKGDYVLRYTSDDSHSYGDWNEDPPDDPQYWGITLYEDTPDVPEAPPAPGLPPPPTPPPKP